MESASVTWNLSSTFRRLRLSSAELIASLTRSPPPLQMITYDEGLASLPDDVIYEIFKLLDTEALKSCSLTGKVLSRSAKPFLHRALHLTPLPGVHDPPRVPGRWNELGGLSVLGQRDLLQHTRHISIRLPCNPLFAHDLQHHTQSLYALTNLRSLKTCWLDIPSFIPKMEIYFGSFLWSLQSLELEFPRGDHNQILYFVCRFPNLRDLRIQGVQDYIHSMRNGCPHFDIKTSPPLDGTLDLKLNTESDMAARLVFNNLIALPSGLKFRTVKLSEYTIDSPQLLIDACAPTLECVDFTGRWFAGSPCRELSFKHHPMFRKLEIRIPELANTELVAAWLSKVLSTITSSVFTQLAINITRVSPSFDNASESQVHEWNSVDNVLDRLSLREDVALVLRPVHWAIEDKFKELVEKYFPLMRENGRVVLEEPPSRLDDTLLWGPRRISNGR